jgi:hypothetical protein
MQEVEETKENRKGSWGRQHSSRIYQIWKEETILKDRERNIIIPIHQETDNHM